jgi:Asp/Glu/hydantoin racemase
MNQLVIINPNSTQAVTDGMKAVVERLRIPAEIKIDYVTLKEGPPAIHSEEDNSRVVPYLCDIVRKRDHEAGAFLIAAFSDPGIHAVREATATPVFGIAESAMLSALTLGDRFGIISNYRRSAPRHVRYVRELGFEQRFTADLPIGLGLLQLKDDKQVLERLIEVGTRLRDDWVSDVVIMGCAGLPRFLEPLESALGIPVVEPIEAGILTALGPCLQN